MFDKIKTFVCGGIKAAVSFVKEKAIEIAGFVAKASFVSIAKYAVGAGVAVATVFATLRFLKEKYTMAVAGRSSEPAPVDRGLNANYHDRRKARQLHPKLRRVVEDALNYKTNRRTKKYGWVNDFIAKYESKHGELDPYSCNSPASREWWEDNIRFSYDDTTVDHRTPQQKMWDFIENYDEEKINGCKPDWYDQDLRDVWDYSWRFGGKYGAY